MAFRAFVIQPISCRCHCRPNCGAVLDEADTHPLQVLQKPIVIQRHWTYHVGTACKRNDSNTIVRPSFNKLAGYLANRIYTRRFLTADCKILD
jgi:hypothetical protein